MVAITIVAPMPGAAIQKVSFLVSKHLKAIFHFDSNMTGNRDICLCRRQSRVRCISIPFDICAFMDAHPRSFAIS